MEIVIAAIAAACYFYGYYRLAFWLIAVALFFTLLVLVKSISCPAWYFQRRAKAGLAEGKGFGALLAIKMAILAMLSLGMMRLAEPAGYEPIRNQIASFCPDKTQGLFKNCATWIRMSQKRP
ncbi:hypothetical protein [Bradyrhizobium commune]|uniref:Uncharacterized protein n=1 Tax=Bradyrhizobium commune TaxID=83627 RepID=A0A7S9D316_9BRAD|nr:hypothetical protein [Bradyrhizobium commune]QPF90249.1 hypothetical protein IC761_27660 [Bradyrhizobium commune]